MSLVPSQAGPSLCGAAGRPASGAAPTGVDRLSGPPGSPCARATWRDRLRASSAPALTGGLVAGVTVVVALVDPHRPGSFGVCPLYALTGLYCVGCGGLRATYDLAHGDLAGAWSMNPLWVLLVPVLVALWGRWFARRWTSVRPGADPVGDVAPAAKGGAVRTPWIVLVVLVAYSAARNVPVLAPWLVP